MRQSEMIRLKLTSAERRNGPNADLVALASKPDHHRLVRGQGNTSKTTLKKRLNEKKTFKNDSNTP